MKKKTVIYGATFDSQLSFREYFTSVTVSPLETCGFIISKIKSFKILTPSKFFK